MNPTIELLPVDTQGRVRVPAERREMLLDEFERCGTSAAAFAKRVGVKYPTFAFWVQRRRKLRKADAGLPQVEAAPSRRWVEATVATTARSAIALRIALPGGAHAEIGSSCEAEMIAEVLHALAKKRSEVASC